MSVDGAPGSNDMPGKIIFSTNAGGTSVTDRLEIDKSGRLLLGPGAIALPKGSSTGSMDLDNGNITMCIGGNSNSTGRTNSTDKVNRVTSPHYTNTEEPVMMITSFNQSGNNTIGYGGGSNQTNTVTKHSFYTAANTTTTTGTERFTIDTNGNSQFTGIVTASNFTSSGTVLIDTNIYSEAGGDFDDLIIGSTSDTAKGISIVGSTSGGVGSLVITDGASYKNQGVIQSRHADDSMRFNTNQNEAFRIDSSRRLLLGHTTSCLLYTSPSPRD